MRAVVAVSVMHVLLFVLHVCVLNIILNIHFVNYLVKLLIDSFF